jgi:hypothetical protein
MSEFAWFSLLDYFWHVRLIEQPTHQILHDDSSSMNNNVITLNILNCLISKKYWSCRCKSYMSSNIWLIGGRISDGYESNKSNGVTLNTFTELIHKSVHTSKFTLLSEIWPFTSFKITLWSGGSRHFVYLLIRWQTLKLKHIQISCLRFDILVISNKVLWIPRFFSY